MATLDKLIITNRLALLSKYKPAGLRSIQAALQRLVTADKARGLSSVVLYIDDATQMGPLGGTAVVSAADQRGAKAAVDAAFAKLKPDYTLLLDGPDVVPHIDLLPIHGLNDSDPTIPSDLPYACAAGWSTQASAFVAVTRVVGRLPMAEGATSAADLVGLIDRAAQHAPLPPHAYRNPFAISAVPWKGSTTLSVATVFGAGNSIHLSPPDGHPGINASLRQQAHFINCHGGQADPNFYGQKGNNYPVAIESAHLAPYVVAGTVVAAECCYGAELYDYQKLGIHHPICMTYLLGGATAFVGSTTIAYGPASGNGQADLLTQYFLANVLAGATVGRAFLQARQSFVQTQSMSNPANLKTLAQFLLLADPSLQAALPSGAAGGRTTGVISARRAAAVLLDQSVFDPALARKERRLDLQTSGTAFGAAASLPGASENASESLRSQLIKLAQAQGMEATEVSLVGVVGGAIFQEMAKSFGGDRKVAVVIDRRLNQGRYTRGASVRLMIAQIIGERVVRTENLESR